MKPSFREWLALTPTERKVFAGLIGAFILGLAIRVYQETFPTKPAVDYAASDSTFAALSALPPEKVTPTQPSAKAGPLNINIATKDDLIRLPGIGEVTAERILQYRDDIGPFVTIEDLRKVKGISKSKLEKLKLLVTVR